MTEINNPLGNAQEIHQPGQQHPGFLKDLSIYLRDFLDTDFKKERKPKRKISRKDRENRLTAIGLKIRDLYARFMGKARATSRWWL